MKPFAVAVLAVCLPWCPLQACFALELALETQPDAAQPDAQPAVGNDVAAEKHPAHAELRELRQAVLKAVTDNDVDALLTHLHPNVVVVWQNAEISQDHEGIRDYYRRMMQGPDRIVESVTIDAAPLELTILHGEDAGIAFGEGKAHFVLRQGPSVDLDGPWSATVVRHEGRWKIASFHASVNAFDNPFVAVIQRMLYWVGGGAFVLGAVVGVIAILIMKRRRAPAT